MTTPSTAMPRKTHLRVEIPEESKESAEHGDGLLKTLGITEEILKKKAVQILGYLQIVEKEKEFEFGQAVRNLLTLCTGSESPIEYSAVKRMNSKGKTKTFSVAKTRSGKEIAKSPHLHAVQFEVFKTLYEQIIQTYNNLSKTNS